MQLLINLATLATAVAALLAILEMRSQRRSSYKPDLVVEAATFVVSRIPAGYRLVTASRQSSTEAEIVRYLDRIALKCANVGAGTAKNISYRWSCDFLKFVERIGRLDPSAAAMITVDDRLLSIGVEPASTHHLAPQLRGHVLAVRPDADQETDFPLPYVYLGLLGVYFESAARATADISRFENIAVGVELELALSYRDLDNSVHQKVFRVVPHLVVLARQTTANAAQHPEVLAEGYFEVTEA